MRRSAVLLVVVTITLGLAACSSSSISKPDYLVKANAICKASNTRMTADAKKLDQTSEAAVEKFLTATYLPEIRSDLAQIEKLGYPKGDKAKLQSMFNATDALITKVDSDPTKFLVQTDPFTALDKQLSAYGLKSCGTNG